MKDLFHFALISLLSTFATASRYQQLLHPIEAMNSQIAITDELPTHRNIQIFTSLVRDVEPVSRLLSSASKQNFTVLAPTNAAMTSLPHKPWEDPSEYATLGTNAYSGNAGQERAQKNIRRFVEAHIVAKAPWAENDKTAPLVEAEGETRKSKVLWWEDAGGGSRVIAPDGVKVENVAAKVANGEVWILDGTLAP